MNFRSGGNQICCIFYKNSPALPAVAFFFCKFNARCTYYSHATSLPPLLGGSTARGGTGGGTLKHYTNSSNSNIPPPPLTLWSSAVVDGRNEICKTYRRHRAFQFADLPAATQQWRSVRLQKEFSGEESLPLVRSKFDSRVSLLLLLLMPLLPLFTYPSVCGTSTQESFASSYSSVTSIKMGVPCGLVGGSLVSLSLFS